MTQAIAVENLAKKYIIGRQAPEKYLTFRDALTNAANSMRSRILFHPKPARGDASEEFWALRNITFTVDQGERLGIIGRNGAGKSTLLKLLSRITEPTRGTIRIRGRVASLLEVGTGFHQELTGRENIFLNGAILGMSRTEIIRKFDEIVAFAEVERFLDTPVKRYSSGMYVRLAFSVAAHLEPEILIVDEVLAVGDIQFQKKCLGKMEDVSKQGRTVLFVSHNMASLQSLTENCILLNAGELITYGPTSQVIARYQNTFHTDAIGQTDLRAAAHYGNGKARFQSITLQATKDGAAIPFVSTGDTLDFTVMVHATKAITFANVGLTLYDELGNRLVDANSIVKGEGLTLAAGQSASVRFSLKHVLLNAGLYTAGLWLGIANQEDIDGVRYATSFQIEPRRQDILYSPPFPGPYACDFEHQVSLTNNTVAGGN